MEGRLSQVSPATVNHIICYCDDCQAFAHHLERADLLDGHGGTDIVQTAPARLAFQRGTDRIVGVRLSHKGLFRWYAGCCKTPLGNTLSPGIPFVGITAQALDPGPDRKLDDVAGQAAGILGKYAIGERPPGSARFNPRLIGRAIGRILGWRLTGKAWPHPFFENRRSPRFPITVLSTAERDALRPLCGPRPATAAHGQPAS